MASNSANVASVLTHDLASFLSLADHRKVQIIVHEMISKDVVQAVRDGRATLGIIWDNTETSGLQQVEYGRDQVAVAMKQGHPLSDQQQIQYADVVRFDMVSMKHTRHTEALIRRTGAISDERIRVKLEVPTWEAGLRAAALGVGVFVCPAQVAHLYADTLGLHVMPLTDAWAQQTYKIIYPTGLVNPLAMQLVAHLSHQHRTLKAKPAPPPALANARE